MHNEYRKTEGFDFITHNFKRIAEVWLDDYKECLYQREPIKYANVDAGDLEIQKLIKKNLNCKPFKHFLEHVMPDMLEKFPCVEPGVFASGVIQSEADPELCVDSMEEPYIKVPILSDCESNLTHPGVTQNFALTWHRNIASDHDYFFCLETKSMLFHYCDFKFKKQLWFYNLTSHQILNPPSEMCLTAQLSTFTLSLEACSSDDINQKWLWGYTNTSALLNWESYGEKMVK